MADAANLVIRNRKFSAMALLSIMVFGESRNYQVSLTEKCQHLLDMGIKITKQALDKRLNDQAARFLKSMLEELLKVKMFDDQAGKVVKTFKEINIIDATSFQLPGKLEGEYKGFGGGASTGGVKTHYQIDITTGDGIGIEVTNAASSDSKTNLIVPGKGTLQLFDLGYISFDILKKIGVAAAYYLCRIKYSTRVWIKTKDGFERLNWNEQIKKMQEGQIEELIVYIGSEREIECRMIIEKVPCKLADEKRRKLKTDKVNKRKSLSKGRLAFCDLNVFITNASSDQVPTQNVRVLYGLRWQIEIYFKTWKSFMNIDKSRNMNVHRFNCTHYGALIYIILTTKLFFYFKHQHWNLHQIELSELKAMKLLSKRKDMVWKLLFASVHSAHRTLNALKENLLTNCIKERRLKIPTPYETINYTLS